MTLTQKLMFSASLWGIEASINFEQLYTVPVSSPSLGSLPKGSVLFNELLSFLGRNSFLESGMMMMIITMMMMIIII